MIISLKDENYPYSLVYIDPTSLTRPATPAGVCAKLTLPAGLLSLFGTQSTATPGPSFLCLAPNYVPATPPPLSHVGPQRLKDCYIN